MIIYLGIWIKKSWYYCSWINGGSISLLLYCCALNQFGTHHHPLWAWLMDSFSSSLTQAELIRGILMEPFFNPSEQWNVETMWQSYVKLHFRYGALSALCHTSSHNDMRNVCNKRESPTKIAAIYSLSLFASWYMILHNKTIDQGHVVLFFLSSWNELNPWDFTNDNSPQLW